MKGKMLYFTGAKADEKTELGISYGSISGWIGSKTKNKSKDRFAVSERIFEAKSFDEKMNILLEEAVPEDVRRIMFAYPIEVALFLKYVSEIKGLENIKLRDIRKNISLIGCFKSSLEEYDLEKFLDNEIIVVDNGIRASEGTISIGIDPKTRNGMPAIQQTFLEFKERDSKEKPVLVHQLKEGKEYEVIITTPYGLYRYHIGDIVRVTGRKEKLPLVEFVGRNKTMDMVGEHAPYDQIEKSVNEAKKNANTTLINYTVVPNFEEQMPYYEIIIETEEKNANKLKIFLKKFDLELQESVCSYARMRKKGDFYRLQAPKMSIVQKGTYDKINKQRIINEPQPKAKHIIGGPAGHQFRQSIQVEKKIEMNE